MSEYPPEEMAMVTKLAREIQLPKGGRLEDVMLHVTKQSEFNVYSLRIRIKGKTHHLLSAVSPLSDRKETMVEIIELLRQEYGFGGNDASCIEGGQKITEGGAATQIISVSPEKQKEVKRILQQRGIRAVRKEFLSFNEEVVTVGNETPEGYSLGEHIDLQVQPKNMTEFVSAEFSLEQRDTYFLRKRVLDYVDHRYSVYLRVSIAQGARELVHVLVDIFYRWNGGYLDGDSGGYGRHVDAAPKEKGWKDADSFYESWDTGNSYINDEDENDGAWDNYDEDDDDGED